MTWVVFDAGIFYENNYETICYKVLQFVKKIFWVVPNHKWVWKAMRSQVWIRPVLPYNNSRPTKYWMLKIMKEQGNTVNDWWMISLVFFTINRWMGQVLSPLQQARLWEVEVDNATKRGRLSSSSPRNQTQGAYPASQTHYTKPTLLKLSVNVSNHHSMFQITSIN